MASSKVRREAADDWTATARILEHMPADERLPAFKRVARGLGAYVRMGDLDEARMRQRLRRLALTSGLIRAHGVDKVHAAMMDGFAASAADAPGALSRFALIPFAKLVPKTNPEYLIKNLLPRAGLAVLWGPAKCGKSFWAMSTALHVALNREYRGRKVNGGPVVYCAFEGAEGYGKRAEAFRRRFLPDHAAPVPFFLIAARADLIADHHMLITSIRTCLQDRAPVAVYLDTLNRSLNGSESSDQDMNAYLRAADAVREAFGCLVIIVHHCGIDPSRPRGHTSLTGAVDAQLACRRDAADNIIVTVEWMKDGPEGDTDVSRLEPVEVGSEEGGGPITSCVVVPAVDATPAVAGRAERMPRGAARALRALREALQEGDPHTIEGRAVLAIEVWRSWAYRQGISLSNQPRAQQAAFQRAVAHLVAAGLVVVDGDYAWPADNGSGEHANKANTL